VRELTDDKRLEKNERKRLQVEHARDSSPQLERVVIAASMTGHFHVTVLSGADRAYPLLLPNVCNRFRR
jgi:hypothetical protein